MEHEYENIIVYLTTYKEHIESGIPKALEHEEIQWIQVEKLFELGWAPADIPTVEVLCL